MDRRFKQRIQQVDTERRVHLCDRVMKWYTPLVLGGVMALYVAFSSDHKATRYTVGGAGAAAVVAGVGTAAYGLSRRLQAPKHIEHYEDQSDAPCDVVRISQPIEYRRF